MNKEKQRKPSATSKDPTDQWQGKGSTPKTPAKNYADNWDKIFKAKDTSKNK